MGAVQREVKVVCSKSNAFVPANSTGWAKCPACGHEVAVDPVEGSAFHTLRAHLPRPLPEGDLAAIDVMVARHYPNATGDGVRGFEPHVLELLASLAGVKYPVQRFADLDRLARMADVRQANRVSDNVVFACFAGSDR